MFAREFIKVLEQFKDKTVFVDLFGGSGLLSHITKHQRPDATVVYNDLTVTADVWKRYHRQMPCWPICVP